MTRSVCNICPRQCAAVRTETENLKGYCRMPSLPMVARAALHTGEEPCISGTRGSGTVFFSGCSLKCRFCQNQPISCGETGKIISVQRLADIFRELEQAGAHNINLVNPTHFTAQIRQALDLYNPSIPIVYNSGGYERVETLRMLEGYVDIYLPDCKYIHGEIAAALSDAVDYFEYAAPAILEMVRQTGPVVLDEEGLMQRGTMVRHLVLPGHTRESMEVLDWLAGYKDRLWVSLLFQYTPMGNLAGYTELQRPLTRRECDKVWGHMSELGITDGYVQDRASSGKSMIPTFDYTGV